METKAPKGTDERERLLAYMSMLVDKREIMDAEIDGNTVTQGREEWLVLTDSEADKMARDHILDSLWAFNASFILGECGLDSSGEDALRTMQEEKCEDANDFVLSLIKRTCGIDDFVSSAISADGRGHFLSQYDGEEHEAHINGTYYFMYRTN